jgi:hypothetical protein
MLVCDVLRCAVLGGAAALAIGHRLEFWLLLAPAAAGGLLTMSFELARSAWVALTVAPDRLAACNARLEIGSSLSEVAGFATAGWLYQGLGAGFVLIADAASYLVSAACLSGVPGNAATLLGVALGSWVGEAHGVRMALALAAGCLAAATTLALLRLDPRRKASH